jgi:hypothetical protein
MLRQKLNRKNATATVSIYVMARGGGIWHSIARSTNMLGPAIGSTCFQMHLVFACRLLKLGRDLRLDIFPAAACQAFYWMGDLGN